jgi:hypothetical protein
MTIKKSAWNDDRATWDSITHDKIREGIINHFLEKKEQLDEYIERENRLIASGYNGPTNNRVEAEAFRDLLKRESVHYEHLIAALRVLELPPSKELIQARLNLLGLFQQRAFNTELKARSIYVHVCTTNISYKE